ncbi:predicted protein [Sclerotinia sclerotiorum 1980 UF-70]|uniref:Uncharacterized protein n=2 Tax=Sclerotinia sclerotiorum (strain ATCC 18683 / 1980 / Ss-1) TaxID=665079 RepID=A0A1D9Q1T3_SCLS1|nr:predicted protein [Sclerotinia sclerotiorum 1980 UF-70]APA08839.1 hypothetical protein sscle_04g036090 [Sclerotinia sclerotiorum 1980 UF-70]EDN99782.1 predicted protein [Sclerotinia sclerotiorum 1980 UF-70]
MSRSPAEMLLTFTLLLVYICFYSVLITITLPMTFFGVCLGINTVFQAVLERVLGPLIARQLLGNDDPVLEGLIAERRRLLGGRPMPGQYTLDEEIDTPQNPLDEEIDAPQERVRRPFRILLMEREMLNEHRIAQYRGWLRQMEHPAEWELEDIEAQVTEDFESDEAD